MKNIFKKSFITLLALIMVLASMNAFAFAADTTKDYKVTSYTVTNAAGGQPSVISKGDVVNILVTIKLNNTESTGVTTSDVSRLVDSFSGGSVTSISEITGQASKTYNIQFSTLKYTGSGQELKFMVQNGSSYEELSVDIKEAKEYTEPKEDDSTSTYTPDPLPAPKAIFSRNELTSDLKSGKTEAITITVKNVGKAVMQNPIITLTPSSGITIIGGTTAYELTSINPGKTTSVTVQVKGASKIDSETQNIDCELDFDYYNRVSTQSTSAKGSVTVPAKTTSKTDETTDETKTASPVPNIIVTKFNYGGSSVAAGSEFNFGFSFKNTSGSIKAENIVVTVDPGTNITLNGSSNTSYFDKLKPGKSATVSVPMRVLKTIETSSETVTISFKYEYVDNKTRTQATAETKLTVPLYQPDKFEISDPVIPDYIQEGMETTITLNYVNKSKTSISNVEANVEGDLYTAISSQNIGNIEPGKSGTVVFSVTPNAVGENNYTVTINYEDGNGDEKERVFTGVMNVEAAEPYVPDDNGGDIAPVDEGGGIPWWIFAIMAVVVIVAAIIVLKKVKKAKLAKKEQELWDSWDEELGSGSGSADANNDKGDK